MNQPPPGPISEVSILFTPGFDAIEFLVERKFSDYKILDRLANRKNHPLGQLITDPISPQSQQRLEALQKYRADMKALPPQDLIEAVKKERALQAEEWQEKKRREEAARFYNLPSANADFTHWSKATYWTLDEAIALAFGKAPETVKWEKLKEYAEISPFVRDFARVRDLAIRAKEWQQLYDPIVPSLFLAWTRRSDIPVPRELMAAVEARGIVVGDWKDVYDKLKVDFDALHKDRDQLADICKRLIAERNALQARTAALEEQVSGWQFDESAEDYPAELDAAMMAWRAVQKNRDQSVTVKQQLLAWLQKNYPKLTDEARERIATVCNWGKRGGRPVQSQ